MTQATRKRRASSHPSKGATKGAAAKGAANKGAGKKAPAKKGGGGASRVVSRKATATRPASGSRALAVAGGTPAREAARPGARSRGATRTLATATLANTVALSQLQRLLREIGAIVAFFAALTASLALATFDVDDPGWSHTGSGDAIANSVGRAGAWFADVAFYLFGFMAWLLPAVLVLTGYLLFRDERRAAAGYRPFVFVRVIGIALMLAAASGLADLHFAVGDGALPRGTFGGGILGTAIAWRLVAYLHHLGTTLLLLALFFSSLTLAFGTSWLSVIESIGAFLARGVERLQGGFERRAESRQERELQREADAARLARREDGVAGALRAIEGGQRTLPIDADRPAARGGFGAGPGAGGRARRGLLASLFGTHGDARAVAHRAASAVARLAEGPGPDDPALARDEALARSLDEADALLAGRRPQAGFAAADEPERVPDAGDGDTNGAPGPSRRRRAKASDASAAANAETADASDAAAGSDADAEDVLTIPARGATPRKGASKPVSDSAAASVAAAAAAPEAAPEAASEAEAAPVVVPVAAAHPEREGSGARNVHDITGTVPPEDKPKEIAIKPRAVSAERQAKLYLDVPDSDLPSLKLLDEPKPQTEGYSNEELRRLSLLLEEKLAEFRVQVEVVAVQPGPVITLFEMELAPGIKASKVSGLSQDIARSLSLPSVRVLEVIPGKNTIGLEVPNVHRETVSLTELLMSEQYSKSTKPLTLALGKEISGKAVVFDLASAPHLLAAGTTGAGKSVAVNAMLVSLLYKCTAKDLRLILIDPKMLELNVYDGIPHLLTPVVTDMKEATNALRWCVAEMERRYMVMAALKVRNIAGYNRKIREAEEAGTPLTDPLWDPELAMNPSGPPPLLEPMPFIVVVVDEFADMMIQVGKKAEELIARITAKARASGIHLILATQRPSVDVITGLIKANVPSRIAFRVSSKIDSGTIIGQNGAESLLGYGDSLFQPVGKEPQRVHGAFVDDHEVQAVAQHLKSTGEPQYIEAILQENQGAIPGLSADAGGGGGDPEADELYDTACQIVLESGRASISYVQRRLKVGYNRAARMVEDMESAGLVSPEVNGKREVLPPGGG